MDDVRLKVKALAMIYVGMALDRPHREIKRAVLNSFPTAWIDRQIKQGFGCPAWICDSVKERIQDEVLRGAGHE
ncbi:MAG: hypothetical protein LBT97_03185 [Planctomycetota bacterium]|jgi:hypothetical protein|nr:hypothetical protein [Planctomycetota bacterium]